MAKAKKLIHPDLFKALAVSSAVFPSAETQQGSPIVEHSVAEALTPVSQSFQYTPSGKLGVSDREFMLGIHQHVTSMPDAQLEATTRVARAKAKIAEAQNLRVEAMRLKAEAEGDIERIDKFTELRDWLESDQHVLQPNEHTRLHSLMESFAVAKVIYLKTSGSVEDPDVDVGQVSEAILKGMQDLQTFIVQHNWADAFAGAENFEQQDDDEHKLPFPWCAFEFRVTGRTVIGIVSEASKHIKVDVGEEVTEIIHADVRAFFFVEISNGYWYCAPQVSGMSGYVAGFDLAWQQIRAICIALEARVATYDRVEAPTKLNKKRLENGKLPIFSHHIIDLSKKYRAHSHGSAGATGRHVRLHFRRRHKRHYKSGQVVQIEWMLVGDPDLGFIDKTYKL